MKRLNVRVYGLWLENGKVALCKETVAGTEIVKFPGGGLEFGEGTIDCLKREWMEEMECEIEVLDHFYTTDYFQPSAYDDSQVISIYYLVRPTKLIKLPIYNSREHFYFANVDETLLPEISLPIDKVVVALLLSKFI